jgi:hypothetical protein
MIMTAHTLDAKSPSQKPPTAITVLLAGAKAMRTKAKKMMSDGWILKIRN